MSSSSSWEVSPFLHHSDERIYDPLTDRALVPADEAWTHFQGFLDTGRPHEQLVRDGWVLPAGTDLSKRFHLKIVSLETSSTCNQKCYFCPVSVAPRPDEEMPTEVFERVVSQLAEFRDTIEGVFLQSYNEPTADRRFVQHCRTLTEAGLPVAVLTNGSGLTPKNADELVRMGGLRYLCVNLSTVDDEAYQRDRGADHLKIVLRNLDHMRDLRVAKEMRIIVLGKGDAEHDRNFLEVQERYAGSLFDIQRHVTVDRGGWQLEVGYAAVRHVGRLAGCDLLGSRPLQHIHITASGDCILCCQDYDERYVVGSVQRESVREILEGDQMALMRRWTYGVEEAPDDFICRSCVFAITR